MDHNRPALRTCPACGSTGYLFRSRKAIVPELAQSEGKLIETKYRCKQCGHEWRVRMSR
jgi:DNA-directed RNA polymerase subunit M/transcription elongation factor TFIIS